MVNLKLLFNIMLTVSSSLIANSAVPASNFVLYIHY